ncbi:MAG: type II toxin-antitoxin system VapC family toxin [Halorientalis sp.]
MRVFVDTNIFVASLTDEPGRGETATALLDRDDEFLTSVLNLMELRTVLTKKKRIEQERVESTLDDIADNVTICAPEISDQTAAYEKQKETLLYPLDCVLLALATDLDAEFVTFDSELLDHGAVSPEDIL